MLLLRDPACRLEGHHGLVVLSDLLKGVPQVNQGLHLARVARSAVREGTRLRSRRGPLRQNSPLVHRPAPPGSNGLRLRAGRQRSDTMRPRVWRPGPPPARETRRLERRSPPTLPDWQKGSAGRAGSAAGETQAHARGEHQDPAEQRA